MTDLSSLLNPDETLDDLRVGGLRIIQRRNGYRFSIDPLLLCAFSRIEPGEHVVDLGTGCGVIPLVLARRSAAAEIIGVELQQGLADRARRSTLLNGLQDRVRILQADVRDLGVAVPAGRYSVVLSNPPFRPVGSGRQAPEQERAIARHELGGQLVDFLQAAAYLLKPGGRFYMIYLAERLAELLETMRALRLEPKRMRCVHGRIGEPARMVLVEGRRDGRSGMQVGKPLLVFCGSDYSEEVRGIYDDPGEGF